MKRENNGSLSFSIDKMERVFTDTQSDLTLNNRPWHLTTRYQKGYLTTDLGNLILAGVYIDDAIVSEIQGQNELIFNNIQELHEKYSIREEHLLSPSFNCHGFVFGDSEYWINCDQVETILNDEYERIDKPQKNCVLILRGNLDGRISHSACYYDTHDECKLNNCALHKPGIRKLTCCQIEEVCKNYCNTKINYYMPKAGRISSCIKACQV